MRIRRVLAASSAAVIAATSLAACSSGDSDGKIVVGTTDAAKKAWSAFEDEAEAQGLDIEVQNFSDYNTPNQALDQGELDTNNFQHLKFLAEFNKGNGTDLVPIVATEIVPLALFWQVTTPSTASRARKSPSRMTPPTRDAPSTSSYRPSWLR